MSFLIGNPVAPSAFSVCISNPIVVQTDIFNEWLRGKSDIEAMEVYAGKKAAEPSPELLSIVQSQFRMFELLEVHLQRPRFFIDQCFFPLPLEIKRTLLEFYYSFDGEIVRELLDKKMSSRGRRDLDEICSYSGQPLASIRRQFETLKRVQRRVEDLPGDLNSNIQRKFLLSKSLSTKYSAIVLLNKHRLEVGRRKLPIPTPAVLECAEALFTHMTLSSSTAEFDYLLARDIREMRSTGLAAGRTSDLADALVDALMTLTQDASDLVERIIEPLEAEEYALLAGLLDHILQIGSGLSQAKEIRDLLVDINEFVAGPLRAASYSRSDVELLLEALSSLPVSHPSSWIRLMTALKLCTLAILYA